MDSIGTSSLQAIATAPTSDLVKVTKGRKSVSSLKHHAARRHHAASRHTAPRRHTYSTSSLRRRATSSLVRQVMAPTSLGGSSSLYGGSSSLSGGSSMLPSTSSMVMSLGPHGRRHRAASGHSHAHRSLKHALAVANAKKDGMF